MIGGLEKSRWGAVVACGLVVGGGGGWWGGWGGGGGGGGVTKSFVVHESYNCTGYHVEI